MHFTMPAVGWVFLAVLALVFLRMIGAPLGRPVGLLIRLVIGAGVLWAIDLLMSQTGIHVGVNPVSSALVGFLGVPGLIVVGIVYYIAHGGIIP